jgi:hypothetical protein
MFGPAKKAENSIEQASSTSNLLTGFLFPPVPVYTDFDPSLTSSISTPEIYSATI